MSDAQHAEGTISEAVPGTDVTPQAGRLVQVPTQEEFARLEKEQPRFMQKFMDGKMTPEEVWRKLVLHRRVCAGCGSPKCAILIRVFMPLQEAMERNLALVTYMHRWAVMQGIDQIPTVDFGNPPEPFIRASETGWCDNCKSAAEKQAARGPSWCVVEIEKGPGEIAPSVRVTRSLRG